MRRNSSSVLCRPVITKILNIFQKATLWNMKTALPVKTIVVDVQALLCVLLVRERTARARSWQTCVDFDASMRQKK